MEGRFIPPAGAMRATVEAVGLTMLLFLVHFIAELPGPTVLSALTILLLFFLPPIWGWLRVQRETTPGLSGTLWCTLFGLQLGFWVAVAGSLEKAALTLAFGQRFPVPFSLWTSIALLFTVATACAYGLLVPLLQTLVALIKDSSAFAERVRATQRPRTLPRALLASFAPGMGHLYIGQTLRGTRFLKVALGLFVLGFVIGISALILLVEANLATLPLVIAAGILLLSPGFLALISAMDLLILGVRRETSA